MSTATRVPARRPRTARWIAVALGLLVLGGVIAVAARLGQDPSNEVAADSPLLGRTAPAFSLAPVTGGPDVSSSQLAGHFAVVYFFATWCPACRAEVPALVASEWHWAPRGVRFVGIAYSDSPAAVAAFGRQSGIGWPLLSDPGDQVALRYGVFGIPEAFVLGPSGRVLAKLVGEVGPGQLDRVLGRLMAGAAPISQRGPGFVPAPPAGAPAPG